jgi:hypothetical protein
VNKIKENISTHLQDAQTEGSLETLCITAHTNTDYSSLWKLLLSVVSMKMI